MPIKIAASAAIAAAVLSLAGAAQAQISNVENICEIVGPGFINTVRVRTLSPSLLDYTFRNLASGQLFTFPGTTVTWAPRTIMLPPGSYAFTFKHPNAAPVGTYSRTVVVKPFRIVRGTCMFVTDTAVQAGTTRQ